MLARPGYDTLAFSFSARAGKTEPAYKVQWKKAPDEKMPLPITGPVAEEATSADGRTPLPGKDQPSLAAAAKKKKKRKSSAADSADQPDGKSADADEPVLALHARKRLLVTTEYPALRKIFADRFEKQYQREIRNAFAADYETMAGWLAAHNDIKEEFYTAIDRAHDKVPAALALFKELVKRFPDKIQAYASLAIALAVTWDDERQGVYDYTGHQLRTKSKLPEGMLGAMENFKYLLDAERVMQGRVQFLPWEFLVHVVNHKTPLAERQWALANYLPKRVMFGKCYADVPYDMEMLNTESKSARLNDKDYTLPNLLKFGGVCSMQADFAARVGKSLGVPAAYVGGEANNGEHHAWVMWVELLGVSRNGINFSLQSHGTGISPTNTTWATSAICKPASKSPIASWIRLHCVGMNPQACRHAGLVMKVYPMLRERTKMSVTDQLVFLNQVIKLCPGNEEAWIAMSKISREGGVAKDYHRQMMIVVDHLFRTFADFPDFTWKVFDDLIAFQDVAEASATRPTPGWSRSMSRRDVSDLACEARLKLSDYLVDDHRARDAIEGLGRPSRCSPAKAVTCRRCWINWKESARTSRGGGRYAAVVLSAVPAARSQNAR